jgi:hypothetical protein
VNFYTREQVLELIGIEAGFLLALEREEIVSFDAPRVRPLLGAHAGARAWPTSWSTTSM